MRRRLVLAAAALALACSRDLELPSRNRLAIDPSFTTVAPRELLTLSASGGAGAYRFSFGEGGRLSGADASVGETSGVYQAGQDGSAQDIVIVTDGAGSTAEARITVGARIAATPSVAYVSPGESLEPTITGGKFPYSYRLVPTAASTASLLGTTYTAGPEGDVVDEVVVTDATLDPEAVATMVIHVGPRVRLYPPGAKVAPNGSLPFVALGGQPPYTFTLAEVQSGVGAGAPTIAPDGTYVAGSNVLGGLRIDVVRVTDALGQIDESPVVVGPPLAVSLSVSSVEPGVPAQLVASGGEPPYTFEFEPRGNRSRGTVDAGGGVYTPGANYGAIDLLQVEDATGTIARLTPAPVVGAARFDARARSWRCVVADVNGDGRQDVAVLRWSANNSNTLVDVTTHVEPAGLPASDETYWLPSGLEYARTLAADLDGDGHDEIWFLDGATATPLVPDLGGNLSLGMAQPLPTVATVAPAPIPGGLRFYSTETCAAAGPRNGIQVFDWLIGSSPGSKTCLGMPWTSGRSISWIAAGDVNGDGYTDLAWTESFDPASERGRLLVAYGAADGSFPATPSASVQFPDPGSGRYWKNDPVPNDPDGTLQIFPGGVAATVAYAPYANTKAIAAWRPAASTLQILDPAGATAGGTLGGFRVSDGTIVAWADTSATVWGYAWDPTASGGSGAFTERDVLPNPTPLVDGPGSVCLADLDGDRAPDLVTASAASGLVSVYRGDGGGVFGRRARFAGPLSSGAIAVASIDGGALDDVVVGTAKPGLRLLWSGAHQLADGGETQLLLAPRAIALADFLGLGGRSALVLDQGGSVAAYPISSAGEVGARVAFTLVGSALGTIGAIRPARFDGDSGVGFWGATGGDSPGLNYYYPTMFIRNGASSFTVTEPYPAKDDAFRCAVEPVGKDVAGVLRTKDVVELCTTDLVSIGLWRAALSSRNPFTFASCAWNDPACSWGPSPVGSRSGLANVIMAGVAPAGRLADGSGVLVGNTGSMDPAAARLWAVVVRAPATDGAALDLTWMDLGTVAGTVDSAAVGDLNGDAYPDLAVHAGGTVYPYLGSALGTYTTTPAVGAAGRIVGIYPLATGAAGDVLMLSGEDLVPLKNDGAGNLQ